MYATVKILQITVSEPEDNYCSLPAMTTLQLPASGSGSATATATDNPRPNNNSYCYYSKAECEITEEKHAKFLGLVRDAIHRQEDEGTGLTSTQIEVMDSLLCDSPIPVAMKASHCFHRLSFIQLKTEDKEAAEKFLRNQQKIRTATAVKKKKLSNSDNYESSASESEDQTQVQEDLRQRQRRRLRFRFRFGQKQFTNNNARRSDKPPSEIYAKVLNYIRKTSLQSHSSGDCLELCQSQASHNLTSETLVLVDTNNFVSPEDGVTASSQSQSSSSGNDSGFSQGYGHGHRIRVRVRDTAVENSWAKSSPSDFEPEADLLASEKCHLMDTPVA